MPRTALAALAAATVIALTGCGSGSDTVAVSGKFGTLPQVTLPAEKPTTFSSSVVSEGTGPAVAAGDIVQAHFVVKNWRGGTVVAQSYATGKPLLLAIGVGQTLPGWDKGLVGRSVGSRVAIVTPPEDALGTEPNRQLRIAGTDTLVSVFDIVKVFNARSSADGTPVTNIPAGLPRVTAADGQKPRISLPDDYSPGPELVAQPLLRGSGPTVKKGDGVLVQYVGVIAESGREFDSSWGNQPANFQIGQGAVIQGWDDAIVGQPVGSRLLLVVPPKLGYKAAGNPQAGIKGTDHLVFVIDLLAIS